MIGSLNDDLMRSHAVHAVKHSFGLPAQVALDDQRRKLVRDHPDGPAWSIALRSVSSVMIRAVGLDLRRSLAFVSVTKGTKTASNLQILANKVGGALGPVGGNDDPAADDRVLPQIWH